MDEVVVQEQRNLPKEVFSDPESFRNLYKIGNLFAQSQLVPQAYQGKPMDCTIAVDMANRMGVSPMFVMQNLYVVKGKPSWSGQACMSMIQASGHFKNVLPVYTGEKGSDNRGCFIKAIRVSDGEEVVGTEITVQMAKAEGWSSNKKWVTMTDQMLAYRAAAFFARVYIPSSLMGCAVEGEVEDSTQAKSKVVDPFEKKEGEK